MSSLTQNFDSTNQVTMTSPEIVDFINAHRQSVATIEKPYVELHHRSFMSKVPQVLGISNAANFLASQNYGNNNTRQIYVFPKREACLMAMSYLMFITKALNVRVYFSSGLSIKVLEK